MAIATALVLLVSGGIRLVVTSAEAAKPAPLSFAPSQWAYEHQSPVEQQSPDFFYGPGTHPETWVSNPTGCVWDVDDDQGRYANGNLDAGAAVEDSVCLIADWAGLNWSGHLAGIWLISASPDLLVTITFTPGRSFTVPPRWNRDSRRYDYKGCNPTPSYGEGDAALQPVPNSNGGVGVTTQIKLIVKNFGARKAAKIEAQWKVGHYYTAAAYC